MKISRNTYSILVSAVIMTVSVLSCQSDWTDDMISGGIQTDNGVRLENEEGRKVMLLYIAGYNDLQSYLKTNIDDLKKGWLPRPARNNDILLVYSHLSVSRWDLATPTVPTLTRLYTDYSGEVVADTLVRYDTGTISASGAQLNNVLTYVRDNFKAKSYGLIFSSHGTGFLPAGYYSNPGDYVFQEKMLYSRGRGNKVDMTYGPYVERETEPGMPMTKSIGQDVAGDRSYELEIDDFARAIPMKLDYILFDACLMGGIEVAYELADKCDRIGFSQAEVLAQGFHYSTIASHLLNNSDEADPVMVCKDYFDHYDAQKDVYRSATISMVDCSRIEPVADICRELFSKYRNGIDNINQSRVQRFYTGNHRWFYDLESIITEAGASEQDIERLRDVVDDCMLFRGHTPEFLKDFEIRTFSGFSMYLPRNGSTHLNHYYKTLQWNKATGLVQ